MITALHMYPHKNIRLDPANYIGKQTYFVTQCCEKRDEHFKESAICGWLLVHLRALSRTYRFAVPAYCIMPNHLHLLLDGLEPSVNLLGFMKAFKIKTSREFTQSHGGILWQKKYYDHILRPKESMDSVAWYIWMNPVRTGLANLPGEYPYAGSFTTSIPKITFLPDEWVPPYRSQKRPPQKAAATKAQT